MSKKAKKKAAKKKKKVSTKKTALDMEKFFAALLNEDNDEEEVLCNDARNLIRKCVRIAEGSAELTIKVKAGQLWNLYGDRVLVVEDQDADIQAIEIDHKYLRHEYGSALEKLLRSEGTLIEERCTL